MGTPRDSIAGMDNLMPPQEPEEERPVPLDALRGDLGSMILGEAEQVVRTAEDAMAHQSIDPFISIPELTGVQEARTGPLHRPIPALAVSVLVFVAAVGAFGHGFAAGTRDRCDSAHCPAVNE